jgi:5'-nucleotidase / UDP-sugar diphosphatase
MQGRNKAFAVAVAFAMTGAGLIVGGCTVNNYPAPPPSPGAQSSAHAISQPKPPAAPTQAKPPAPATTRAVAPVQQPKPAPQPGAEGRSYTIKPGDKLWNIAKDFYGDATKYQKILDANPGLNPDNMKPGTKIVIP